MASIMAAATICASLLYLSSCIRGKSKRQFSHIHICFRSNDFSSQSHDFEFCSSPNMSTAGISSIKERTLLAVIGDEVSCSGLPPRASIQIIASTV